MSLTTERDTDTDLDDAKVRLLDAANSVDFLRPLRTHPYSTVGVAALSGFLLGSKEHPAIMKTLRLTMSFTSLLRPAILAAGKFAASKYAHHAAQEAAAPEQPS